MSLIAYEERGSGPPPGVSDGDNGDDNEDDNEEERNLAMSFVFLKENSPKYLLPVFGLSE